MPHTTVEERERRRERHKALRAIAEADAVVEAAVVKKEDGSIPLASIGNEGRRLVEVTAEVEVEGGTAEAVNVLQAQMVNEFNEQVATNQITPGTRPARWAPASAATTNKLIWKYWVEESCSWGVTTSATTIPVNYYGDNIWPQWTRSTSTSVTASSRAVTYAQAWYKWNENEQYYKHARPYRTTPPPPPSPEELARQKALRDAEEAARKARVAALEFAKEKSHKLLLSILDPKQQEELKTKGHFHCKSKKGILYRIYTGTHGNVKRLDDRGKEIESLCIQPDNVPVYDAMLAQKLHIELNEDEFRKTANITRLYN